MMVERYRSVPLGAAGENIVIGADRFMSLDDLGIAVIVRGDDREVVLEPLKVAKPCLQFTSYMLDLPELGAYPDLKDDLAFLDDGTRGFIVTMSESTAPMRLRVGDEVFVS